MIELRNVGSVYVAHMRDGENRLNRRWLDDMTAALDAVEADEQAEALVTTGTGKFYSNGFDLDWLAQPDTEHMVGFVQDVERLMARLLGFPMVTVAACNGHAFAGGAMLALCHDLRVMRADRGFFCLPEIDIKIPFTAGMDSLILSTLPRVVARETMVTGMRIGGTEAAAKQIVHAAVPADAVLTEAVELAAEHGGKDRHVLSTIKRRMFAETIDHLSNSAGTEPPG